MSYPIVGFVCQTLLKNNRCPLLSSTTTTTFITYNSSYSEKFVHPNLARLIELGGAKIKYLINIFTMTKITKGNNYYLRQEQLNVSMIKM